MQRWEVVQRPGRGSLKPATAVRVCPSQPFFHAGVVQRIRTPGYEPGDWRFESSRPYHFRLVVQWTGRSPPKAEIPVRPRTGRPSFAERRPTGEVPGCLPGLGEFDSRTLRQSSSAQAFVSVVRVEEDRGDVDKLAKSPVFQAGHRGFESRHRYHWPEAHEDE